jgi:hypothetical protein
MRRIDNRSVIWREQDAPRDAAEQREAVLRGEGREEVRISTTPAGRVVATLVLDLRERRRSIPGYVRAVKQWVAAALASVGVPGHLREKLPGVWVGDREVAATAISFKKWVTAGGASIEPGPAGEALLRVALRQKFEEIFGPTASGDAPPALIIVEATGSSGGVGGGT